MTDANARKILGLNSHGFVQLKNVLKCMNVCENSGETMAVGRVLADGRVLQRTFSRASI
jgi:hypothetical protein